MRVGRAATLYHVSTEQSTKGLLQSQPAKGDRLAIENTEKSSAKSCDSPDSHGHVHNVIEVAANPGILVQAVLAGYEVEHTGRPVGHVQYILHHTQDAQ